MKTSRLNGISIFFRYYHANLDKNPYLIFCEKMLVTFLEVIWRTATSSKEMSLTLCWIVEDFCLQFKNLAAMMQFIVKHTLMFKNVIF